MEIAGLILNIAGVLMLVYAQSQLDRTVRLWLTALDFSVETILEPGNKPLARVAGMNEQMKSTVGTNANVTTAGWLVTGLGFIFQLVALLLH